MKEKKLCYSFRTSIELISKLLLIDIHPWRGGFLPEEGSFMLIPDASCIFGPVNRPMGRGILVS
ncbi:hypothetical protein LptCag_2316 [Leptospirillum ferriphilum]|uniref:Uncharacterized protein n=1 Tax=Leptospirillum ferriphilum TaxID=178606 RepID=A0A094WGU8_9BACT|nr:hypothetical protein LptCag_2316 [Leptospirillum ferriphilum]